MELFKKNLLFESPDNSNGGGGNNNQDSDDNFENEDQQSQKPDLSSVLNKLTKEEQALMRQKTYNELKKQFEKQGSLVKEGQKVLNEEEYNELLNYRKQMEELENQKMAEQGKFKELLEQTKSEKEKLEKQLRQENQNLTKKAQSERQQLINALLADRIKTKLHQYNTVNANDAYQIVSNRFRFENDDPSSKILVLDENGKDIVYDEKNKTEPMPVETFIEKLIEDKPYLFEKQRQSSPNVGIGMSASRLSPDDVKNMSNEDFKKLFG